MLLLLLAWFRLPFVGMTFPFLHLVRLSSLLSAMIFDILMSVCFVCLRCWHLRIASSLMVMIPSFYSCLLKHLKSLSIRSLSTSSMRKRRIVLWSGDAFVRSSVLLDIEFLMDFSTSQSENPYHVFRSRVLRSKRKEWLGSTLV